MDSVPAVLDEARRVLRHGAPFVFIEHVVAPPGRPLLRTAQARGGQRHHHPTSCAPAVPGVALLLRLLPCVYFPVLSKQHNQLMAAGFSGERRGNRMFLVAAWCAGLPCTS